jgi:hypothetical protein
MFQQVLKMLAENPKLLKNCGIGFVMIIMLAFSYNSGFNSGVSSVECPKFPAKDVICKIELDRISVLTENLSKCEKSSTKKIQEAIDETRRKETQACDQKIERGIQTCIEFECDLCEAFKK